MAVKIPFRLPTTVRTSPPEPLAWLQTAARSVDLWWYKRVVAYDSTDQAGARIRLRIKWLQWTDELTVSAQDQIDDLFGVSDEYALVPAILLFSGIALSGWLARNAWTCPSTPR